MIAWEYVATAADSMLDLILYFCRTCTPTVSYQFDIGAPARAHHRVRSGRLNPLQIKITWLTRFGGATTRGSSTWATHRRMAPSPRSLALSTALPNVSPASSRAVILWLSFALPAIIEVHIHGTHQMGLCKNLEPSFSRLSRLTLAPRCAA